MKKSDETSENPSPNYFSTLTAELSRRSARAVVSDLGPASAALRGYLRTTMEKAAGLPGSFVGDPVFEPMFDWERAPETMLNLSSSLLDGELVDAMNSPPSALRAYRFDSKWRPYVHQVSAWKALKDTPPRSVIVTSGTGSGKTECFLVPILDELVRESRSRVSWLGYGRCSCIR